MYTLQAVWNFSERSVPGPILKKKKKVSKGIMTCHKTSIFFFLFTRMGKHCRGVPLKL